MAKKKAKKKPAAKQAKVTKKKAAPAKKKVMSGGGGGDSVCDELKEQIVDNLIDWQVNVGRANIKQLMLAMLKPSTAHTQFFQWMVARTTTYHTIIKTAKDAGDTHSWIIPWVAAASFESIFETCSAVWLAAGDADVADELNPSVTEFIDFQVDLFCMAICPS